MAPHLKVWKEKYARSTGARRLLACDGGGILGIMSLEILAEIEKQLADIKQLQPRRVWQWCR